MILGCAGAEIVCWSVDIDGCGGAVWGSGWGGTGVCVGNLTGMRGDVAERRVQAEVRGAG